MAIRVIYMGEGDDGDADSDADNDDPLNQDWQEGEIPIGDPSNGQSHSMESAKRLGLQPALIQQTPSRKTLLQ